MWKKGISDEGFEKLAQFFRGNPTPGKKNTPDRMNNEDMINILVESTKDNIDMHLEMGESLEEAFAHAKEETHGGPAVWAKIEELYKE
jgi:hypothetical protein